MHHGCIVCVCVGGSKNGTDGESDTLTAMAAISNTVVAESNLMSHKDGVWWHSRLFPNIQAHLETRMSKDGCAYWKS